MTTALLALVYITVVTALASWCHKLDTYISPLTVVGLSGLIYLVAIPVEVVVTGRPFNTIRSDEDASKIVILALLGFLAFAVGYIAVLNKERPVSAAIVRVQGSGGSLRTLPLIAAIGFAALIVLAFPGAITTAGTYDGNVALTAGNSIYALLVKYAMQAYAVWAFIVPLRAADTSLYRSLARTLPLVAWGVYSSDKDPLLLAGLTLISHFLVRYRAVKSVTAFVTGLVGAAASVGVATFAFSIYRGGGTAIWDRLMATDGLFRNIEPAGPMRSVLSALDRGATSEFLYGESILRGYIMWIPQSVWTSRPPDLSQQYAMENVANWEPGRAFGFSLVADGLLNGGTLGVILLFAFVGVQVGIIRNFMLRPSAYPEFDAVKLGLLYTVGLFYCFISLRGPFSSLVTQTVHTGALAVGLWLAFGVLRARTERARAGN